MLLLGDQQLVDFLPELSNGTCVKMAVVAVYLGHISSKEAASLRKGAVLCECVLAKVEQTQPFEGIEG